MKKLTGVFCIVLGLLCLPGAYAQYLLTAVSPPPQFTHDDLWNLTVTRSNTQDNYSKFYIALRIYDAQSQLLSKTNSANLDLSQTVTVINIGNLYTVQPFTINYYNAGVLQQVISSGGIFPPGIYNVQFTLYGRPSDGEFTELADHSSQITVDAMWPPMLLSPADGDSIQTPTPVLTWTPAFSTYLSGSVTYRLRVAEIFNGQSKQQAITANQPKYTENNIPMPLQIYPNTAQSLEEGKRYAWQVEANAGSISLGYSEVWEFCYCFPQQTQQQSPGFYYKLTEHPQSQFELVKGNIIPVAFPEKYVPKEEKLYFRLKNTEGKELANQDNFDAPKKIGMNKYQIDLCSDSKLNLKEGYYILEFPTESRFTYYLRIQLSGRIDCR
ncbi:MAG: hypothetical protein IBJ09_01000 [Bacteroidia bacterium]|nr:hypothetical protein [Bacteroidia bacterium]